MSLLSNPTNNPQSTRMNDLLGLLETLLQERRTTVGDRNDITQDTHTSGADAFRKFEESITSVDQAFRAFANTSRQLGGSLAVIAYAVRLRERFNQLLSIYRENTICLFPQTAKSTSPIRRNELEILDIDDLGRLFLVISTDLSGFLDYLNEWGEFHDEEINESIGLFTNDLKYWSSSLKDYEGQFRKNAIQRYVHDLLEEVTKHTESLASSVTSFNDAGLATIKFNQDAAVSNYQNIAMVATFISSVTATTVGYSLEGDTEVLNILITNVSWIISLALSVGSALNSVMAVAWTQATYRGPMSRYTPGFGNYWLKHSPLVLLVLSLILFLFGLSCFTFVTAPKWIMFGLNALVTAFSYGFLLLISAWFWGDADGVQLRDHKLFDHYWSSEASDILRSGPHAQKPSQGSSSFDGENEARQPWYARLFPSTLKRATPPVRYAEDEYYPLEEGAPRSKSFEAGYPTFSDTANKKRSTNSFENVVAPPIFPVPHTETLGRLEWNDAVQNLNGHSAPVKTLQYSADGRYLAVASWDCVAAIHAVREGGRFSTYCVLEAADALGLIDRLAWSPNGKALVATSETGIRVWKTEDGALVKHLTTKNPVTSVAWMPDSQSFIVAGGDLAKTDVIRLDAAGKGLQIYSFPHVHLKDIAPLPDGVRLLGVGTLIDQRGFEPAQSKTQKRLIALNLETERVESQIPFLNEVCGVVVTQSAGKTQALVNFEDGTPPQSWNIDIVKDFETGHQLARLSLHRNYEGVHGILEKAFFAGRAEEFVIGPDSGGRVYIWDTERGALLSVVESKATPGAPTSLAWNWAAADPYAFATGGDSGCVKVWSTVKANAEATLVP